MDSEPSRNSCERLLPADVVHLPGGDVGELAAVGGGRLEDRLEHRGERRLAGGPLLDSGGEGVGGGFGMPAAYPPVPGN